MALPRYLLDNNVISYFFNAGLKGEFSRIADTHSLCVVREVHEEALRYPSKGAEYKKWSRDREEDRARIRSRVLQTVRAKRVSR